MTAGGGSAGAGGTGGSGAMEGLLGSMGLTAYEARSLSHLLRNGPRSGPDLSREAHVPFGRIYDTLNTLLAKGLVTVRPGRPKTYAAVAPAAAAARLAAAEQRRLQEEQQRLAQRTQELERELTRLEPRAAPGPAAAGVRIGEEAAREALVEATHAARREVQAYLAFEAIHDEDLALFDAFRQAVARGVRSRLLLREQDLDYLASTPYVAQVLDAVLPHLGNELQVRLTDRDFPPFSVLDRQRVMVGVRNPVDPRSYFAVLHFDDPTFAEGLVTVFDGLWAQAQEERGLMQSVLRRLSDAPADNWLRRRLGEALRRRARRGDADAPAA